MAVVANKGNVYEPTDRHWHGNASEVHGGGDVGDDSADFILAEYYRGATDQATLEAALVAGAEEGKSIWLEPGRTYRVTKRLVLPANSGLISDGTALIDARATDFTNTGTLSTKTDTNTVVGANGVDNVCVKGIRIQFTAVQNSVVCLVSFFNCTRPVVQGCELWGLSAGYLVSFESCLDGDISHNLLRSCVLDATSMTQVTGIAIDDSIASAVTSRCAIHHNTIRDITVTPAFNTSFGYQADGINLARGDRISITDNFIQNTGEGIDTFATGCAIHGNLFYDSYLYGIKLIHGANYNSVQNNLIFRSGLAGVYVGGSTSNPTHTEKNDVSHNTVSVIDPNGVWVASTTACIITGNDSSVTYKARDNVFSHNILNPGAGGRYAIYREDVSTNYWLDNFFAAAGIDGTYLNLNGGGGPFSSIGALNQSLQSTTTYLTDFLGDQLEDELLSGVGTGTGNAVAISPGIGGRCLLTTSSVVGTHAQQGVSIGLGSLDWRADQGGLVLEARLQVNNWAGFGFFVGFTDALGTTVEAPLWLTAGAAMASDADNACGVLLDSQADAGYFTQGGVKATVDTPPTFILRGVGNGIWFTVRVEVSTAGAMRGFIDGVPLSTVLANAVTVTTPLVPLIFAQNRGAAARTVLVDYFWVRGNRAV